MQDVTGWFSGLYPTKQTFIWGGESTSAQGGRVASLYYTGSLV